MLKIRKNKCNGKNYDLVIPTLTTSHVEEHIQRVEGLDQGKSKESH